MKGKTSMKFTRVLENRGIKYYWTSHNSVVIENIKKPHKIEILNFENHTSIRYDSNEPPGYYGSSVPVKNEIDFIKYLDEALKDAGYIKKTQYKQLNIFGDDNV